MSFGIKYRMEFMDITEKSSDLGVIWKVDILENNFAGNITTLTGGDSPLIFNFDNKADNVFDSIRESHAEISVYSDTDFALQDLYSIELMQFQVNIYADDVLYWWGYIEPQKHEEVYEPAPYLVTISCTDGLSELEAEYKNGDEYYKGRRYISQIILDCIGKLGHTEFIEFVNVYEDTINKTSADSPFDQILIDTYCFRDHSCIEVLTEILQIFNAFIRQKDGIFNIIRPSELIGTTINGRHFTTYNTKSSVTLTPLQYINRTSHPTNRLQVPGGVLMVQPPVHEVVITQNYGNRESWLDNFKFEGDAYLGTQFRDWSEYGIPGAFTVGGADHGENGGLGLPYNTDPDNNYVYQSFGTDSKISTTDDFVIEFDWKFYNSGTSARSGVIFKMQITDGTNYLVEKLIPGFPSFDGSNCEWKASAAFFGITATADIETSTWIHWKRAFIGLPSVGPYTIKIFPLYNSASTIWLGVKDIKFYTSSVSISILPISYTLTYWEKFNRLYFRRYFNKYHPKTETVKEFDPVLTAQYNATNSINGYIVANELSFSLGDVTDNDIDNIPNQFVGALCYATTSILTRIDDVILTTDTGTGEADITCNGNTETAIWNTSLAQTATDFINNHNSDFPGINVSSGAPGIIRFTHGTPGVELVTTIVNTVFDLDGYVSQMQPYIYSISTITPTATWTGGTSSSKKLLQIVADEIAAVYNRPKQLIQYQIMESAKALQINTIGNFQDAVNLYSGAIRIFVMNRGTFDVRNREWNIDLFEIGTGAVVGGTSTTADSTTTTVDSATVTIDSTI
jgi:hypothetical protein